RSTLAYSALAGTGGQPHFLASADHHRRGLHALSARIASAMRRLISRSARRCVPSIPVSHIPGNDTGSGPITIRSLCLRVLSQNYSSGGKGTRTPNPLLAKQMRYQLRHTPVRVLTLTPNRCARTIRLERLGSHAATGRRLRVPRA